jgi:hypothetical protein
VLSYDLKRKYRRPRFFSLVFTRPSESVDIQKALGHTSLNGEPGFEVVSQNIVLGFSMRFDAPKGINQWHYKSSKHLIPELKFLYVGFKASSKTGVWEALGATSSLRFNWFSPTPRDDLHCGISSQV